MAIRNVTVFGGSGFLGRYVVKRLAARGMRVRVAVRDPERAAFVKPMGDVGQVAPVQANIRDQASVARAVDGADAVINCVGILYERGRQRFAAVHADGAGRIAAAAAAAGVGRLLHVSAIGADVDATARYARSKGEGEQAVRDAFAGATIVRPSIMFGPEDDFFNRFALLAQFLPALPLIGGGKTKFQPVYVGDVATAIEGMLDDSGTGGKTYELGGPRVYTFEELLRLLLQQIGRRCLLLPVPFGVVKFQAAFLQMLPVPPLTMDQVELLKSDNVVSEGAEGLDTLGLRATPLEGILPTYIYRYRRGGKLTPSRLG